MRRPRWILRTRSKSKSATSTRHLEACSLLSRRNSDRTRLPPRRPRKPKNWKPWKNREVRTIPCWAQTLSHSKSSEGFRPRSIYRLVQRNRKKCRDTMTWKSPLTKNNLRIISHPIQRVKRRDQTSSWTAFTSRKVLTLSRIKQWSKFTTNISSQCRLPTR